MRYESFYPFQQYAPRQNNPLNSMNGVHPFMPPRAIPQNEQFMSSHNSISGQQEGQGFSKIERYMQTADRVLTTAQQFAPLAQQIAPMVSNLPAMWRLYKGFQSLPSNPDRATTRSPAPAATASRRPEFPSGNQEQITGPRQSIPRIFQPPLP